MALPGYEDTCEVKGKAGIVRVNVADVQEWLDRGYEKVDGSEVAGAPPANDGKGNVAPVEDGDAAVEDAPAEVTREAVDKMKAADLAALVEEKSLAVDLDAYKKIGDKRDAVAAALGLDD